MGGCRPSRNPVLCQAKLGFLDGLAAEGQSFRRLVMFRYGSYFSSARRPGPLANAALALPLVTTTGGSS